MSKTPRIKHRAEVILTNSKGQQLHGWGCTGEQEYQDYGGRGGSTLYLRVPISKVIGRVDEFTVSVEYLGEKQYKQTYQQRVKSLASSEKRRERLEKEQERLKKERDEKQLVQRRNRIVNQIELAFVKEGKEAVNFVTCDKCDGAATHLGLTHENAGSQVIDNDQITGAWCEDHDDKYDRPYKTTATIECARLEFFYNGLRQIYVKAA